MCNFDNCNHTIHNSFWAMALFIINYVSVVEYRGNCCQFADDRASVSVGSGYLANSVTLDTGCGSMSCPWQLQALEAQRINISIYDFGICKYFIKRIKLIKISVHHIQWISCEGEFKNWLNRRSNHIFDHSKEWRWAQNIFNLLATQKKDKPG